MFKYIEVLLLLILVVYSTKIKAQDFYDIDVIQEIHITFTQNNWDYLLDSLIAVGDDRLMAETVSVNGIQFDSVGVRYKGNSSYNVNNSKNPLNIKLSYLKDQDYNGYQTFKLSSGFKDPTFAREVLSYEIARKYMPASKANWVKVYINGNYYGLFTNVEAVNKDFLEDYYSTNDNILFKCDGTPGPPPMGCPFGGGSGLGYRGPDSICYYNNYELKRDYGWSRLIQMIDTLNNNSSFTDKVIYIDRALWMLAYNNVLVNFDSYTGSRHNYYVYEDKNQRFHTILWDLNEAFGVFAQSGMGPPMSIQDMQNLDPLHNMNSMQHPLIEKLLINPLYRKSYIAHYRTILEENFYNNWYAGRLSYFQALIDSAVNMDLNKIYSYQDFINNYTVDIGNIPGIDNFVSARNNALSTNPELLKVPPMISIPDEMPLNPQEGDTVWISTSITNAQNVELRYRYADHDVFMNKVMLDNGLNNDGIFGDGIFGAYLILPSTGLQYYIFAENNDAAMFSPVRAEYEFYEINTNSGLNTGDLVINEFSASNNSIIADVSGVFEDWIELYNNTNEAINLNGLFLSDDLSNITKWAFPDTQIQANEYLLVWADKDENEVGLHTNFKISSGGEALGLWDNAGKLLDSISFGPQISDVTTGRFPNGTGPFISMSPTPQAENINNTSVQELQKLILNFNIFPNPYLEGGLNVIVEIQREQAIEILIINALGQVQYTSSHSMTQGVNQITLDDLDLHPGIYNLVLRNEQDVLITKRLIRI